MKKIYTQLLLLAFLCIGSSVKAQVADETARALLKEYSYCEKIEQDGGVYYIVSKGYENYGIWHNGKLEVPCKYSLEDLKNKYFTVELKELPSGIVFQDAGFRDFCLRDKRLNADKDNMITEEEAKAATRLSLMNFKSFMRNIKSYDDLKYFPTWNFSMPAIHTKIRLI